MDHLTIFDLTVFSGKTVAVLLVLFIGFRLMGKRQVGQLNIFDLAMIMALANAVQNAMTSGSGDLRAGLVSSGTLLITGWIITRSFLRFSSAERLLLGVPTVIINNGKVLKRRLRREGVTKSQLMAAIRQHGIQTCSQVKVGVLEVDGSISIVPESKSHRP